jgi:hypothetical protein
MKPGMRFRAAISYANACARVLPAMLKEVDFGLHKPQCNQYLYAALLSLALTSRAVCFILFQ